MIVDLNGEGSDFGLERQGLEAELNDIFQTRACVDGVVALALDIDGDDICAGKFRCSSVALGAGC